MDSKFKQNIYIYIFWDVPVKDLNLSSFLSKDATYI